MIISDIDIKKSKAIKGQCLLECWSCRKNLKIKIDKDITESINEKGWIASVDFQRKRILVFCSQECKDRGRSKLTGFFRWMSP